MSSSIALDPTHSGDLSIAPLRGIDGVREVERLQSEIWNADPAWVVPSHVLLIVSEYDGILLGARLDGALVGFVLGFLARSDGRLFHASHMLGVLPACRQHGIGAALKWRQRDVARGQGLDLMRWTFDPLEARNAYLNFHKLGAMSTTYRPDYYGPMPDGLNRDLPSDRLIVEWHLDTPRIAPADPGPVQTLVRNVDGEPRLSLNSFDPALPLAIEIPGNTQELKSHAPDLALRWRHAVRDGFAVAFGNGYSACDFQNGAYLLVRETEMTDAN